MIPGLPWRALGFLSLGLVLPAGTVAPALAFQIHESHTVCVETFESGEGPVWGSAIPPPDPPPVVVGCELQGCLPDYEGDGRLELEFEIDLGARGLMIEFQRESDRVGQESVGSRQSRRQIYSGHVEVWRDGWPADYSDRARIFLPWSGGRDLPAPGDRASVRVRQVLVLAVDNTRVVVNRYSVAFTFRNCMQSSGLVSEGSSEDLIFSNNALGDSVLALLWSCPDSGGCRHRFLHGRQRVTVGMLDASTHSITAFSSGDAVAHVPDLGGSRGTWPRLLDLGEPMEVVVLLRGTQSYPLEDSSLERAKCAVALSNHIFDSTGAGIRVAARFEETSDVRRRCHGLDSEPPPGSDVVAFFDNSETDSNGFFCANYDWAVFIGPWAGPHVLAHELGHAFSLCQMTSEHAPQGNLMFMNPSGVDLTPGQLYWINRHEQSRAALRASGGPLFHLAGTCERLPRDEVGCAACSEHQARYPKQGLRELTSEVESPDAPRSAAQFLTDIYRDYLEGIDPPELSGEEKGGPATRGVLAPFLERTLDDGPSDASIAGATSFLNRLNLERIPACGDSAESSYLEAFVMGVRARAARALALVAPDRVTDLLSRRDDRLDETAYQFLEAALSEL